MIKNEQDSAWKDILDAYLKEFIEYCLPELSPLIDWSKGWVSLDKELRAITKNKIKRKSLLDKLFKVVLKEGKEQWLLVHVEIQGTPETAFPERMFTYAYRSYDKYRQPIVSLAILTDNHPDWRPNQFRVGMVGSYLSLEFLAIKILDYANQQAELDASKNPFSCVILGQLSALTSKHKPHRQRKEIKVALTRRLYEKGFNKQEIIHLYHFIDWLIGLPEELEIEYQHEVYEIEETSKMAYVSSIERIGIKKGMQQGIQQGMQQGKQEGMQKGMHEKAAQVALVLLKKGFDLKEIFEITGLNQHQIDALKEEQL